MQVLPIATKIMRDVRIMIYIGEPCILIYIIARILIKGKRVMHSLI